MKYTTVTLLRTGRPSKISPEKIRRNLVREAAERPAATLEELQQFLESTGGSLHVTTISRILHISGFGVGGQDMSLFQPINKLQKHCILCINALFLVNLLHCSNLALCSLVLNM